MRILPETPADIDAIFALTQAAFADHPHSEQTGATSMTRCAARRVDPVAGGA